MWFCFMKNFLGLSSLSDYLDQVCSVSQNEGSADQQRELMMVDLQDQDLAALLWTLIQTSSI